MSKTWLFAIITVAVLGVSGCGSTSEPASNSTAVRTNSNIDRANANSGVIPAGSNSVPTSVAANQSISGITAAPGSASVDANAPSAGNVAGGDRRRVVDIPSSGPVQAPPSVPAPENSSVSSTMAKDGSFVETRVFKGDPAIAKVEKTLNGQSQSVRIFLRTGRVVKVPADQVPAVNSISLDRLRRLAGIKSTVPQPAQTQPGATSSKPRS